MGADALQKPHGFLPCRVISDADNCEDAVRDVFVDFLALEADPYDFQFLLLVPVLTAVR